MIVKSISKHHTVLLDQVDYSDENSLIKELRSWGLNLEGLSRISNEHRRAEWLYVRHLLVKHYNLNVDIFYDKNEKPHLVNSEDFISISHSHHTIALSLHTKHKVGIDVQQISPKIDAVKKKFLSEHELNLLAPLNETDLTALWSIKEALFKLNGKKDIYLLNDIIIEDYNKASGTATGYIKNDNPKQLINVNIELVNNFILAYTLNS